MNHADKYQEFKDSVETKRVVIGVHLNSLFPDLASSDFASAAHFEGDEAWFKLNDKKQKTAEGLAQEFLWQRRCVAVGRAAEFHADLISDCLTGSKLMGGSSKKLRQLVSKAPMHVAQMTSEELLKLTPADIKVMEDKHAKAISKEWRRLGFVGEARRLTETDLARLRQEMDAAGFTQRFPLVEPPEKLPMRGDLTPMVQGVLVETLRAFCVEQARAAIMHALAARGASKLTRPAVDMHVSMNPIADLPDSYDDWSDCPTFIVSCLRSYIYDAVKVLR